MSNSRFVPVTMREYRMLSLAPKLLSTLRNLRKASTEAYKCGRIPALPFVTAGNVIATAQRAFLRKKPKC